MNAKLTRIHWEQAAWRVIAEQIRVRWDIRKAALAEQETMQALLVRCGILD